MIEAPRGAFLAASTFAWMIDKFGCLVDKVHTTLRSVKKPEECKTPDELRTYAYSIMHSEPSLAKELLAAADRAEQSA